MGPASNNWRSAHSQRYVSAHSQRYVPVMLQWHGCGADRAHRRIERIALSMASLSPQEIELLVIVGTGLVVIVSNRLRPDLVALLVLLALGLSGILPSDQALAGFSRSAVIAI